MAKINKNVNKSVNNETVNNEREVTTMNKNTNEIALTIRNGLAIGGNSVKDVYNAIQGLVIKDSYTTEQAIQALICANDIADSNIKMQRAKIYAGLSGNSKLLKELECKNMTELADKMGFSDSKSTISEMSSVYRLCYDEPSEALAKFIASAHPTYTELVKLLSVRNKKGLKTKEEKDKELALFLNTYAPNNSPCWSTVAGLREIIDEFKNAIPINKRSNNDSKNSAANSVVNDDYKSIKPVAELTKKESNDTIRAMKESGDYLENKAKGTVTITANGVSDFMTKLTAIAKKQGVKPLSFTGELVFTITGHTNS